MLKKSKQSVFICLGGRGIHLIDNIFDIPSYESNKNIDQDVLQKYIANPFTIRGHKFDMRLYVLITRYKMMSQ